MASVSPGRGLTVLVALDWGTTALRAALLSADGAVLERRATADGIMSVPGGDAAGFAAIFARVAGPWLAAHPGAAVLASGMIGSRQGWVEAPYLQCPAGFGALSGGLAWVEAEGARIGIVPGLSWQDRDVMRGEETQIAGALAALGLQDGVFVLPGTHSKWAVVQDGMLTGFRTFMTGEVFAALRRHTILARLMPDGDPPFDPAAFDDGVRRAADAAPLHALFTARTDGLFARRPAEALPSYLSGLLVGEEVREALALSPATRVHVICSPALAVPYAHALDLAGVAHRLVEGDVVFGGLHAIARAARLIG